MPAGYPLANTGCLAEKLGDNFAIADYHNRTAGRSVVFLGVVDAQGMHETRGNVVWRDGAILRAFALGVGGPDDLAPLHAAAGH